MYDKSKHHLSIDTLKQIEIDSRQVEIYDILTLSRFYRISANYIYIGTQSDFKDRCVAELLDSTILQIDSEVSA